jgi:calcineurin-like phosphoesterase family protein
MPNRFVIGDTHFGHNNIIKFESKHRPFATIEEHDEALIERWNSVVKLGDRVYHLGDVLFDKANFPILKRLNGRKRLILGNHDHFPLGLYAAYFAEINGVYAYDGVILSHVPVHPQQLEYRFRGNVHGHMHRHVLDDTRYFNASVECNNLTPVAWEVAVAAFPDRPPKDDRKD